MLRLLGWRQRADRRAPHRHDCTYFHDGHSRQDRRILACRGAGRRSPHRIGCRGCGGDRGNRRPWTGAVLAIGVGVSVAMEASGLNGFIDNQVNRAVVKFILPSIEGKITSGSHNITVNFLPAARAAAQATLTLSTAAASCFVGTRLPIWSNMLWRRSSRKIECRSKSH